MTLCLEEGAFKQLGLNDATSGGLYLSQNLWWSFALTSKPTVSFNLAAGPSNLT